jgi:hypothetical protein
MLRWSAVIIIVSGHSISGGFVSSIPGFLPLFDTLTDMPLY